MKEYLAELLINQLLKAPEDNKYIFITGDQIDNIIKDIIEEAEKQINNIKNELDILNINLKYLFYSKDIDKTIKHCQKLYDNYLKLLQDYQGIPEEFYPTRRIGTTTKLSNYYIEKLFQNPNKWVEISDIPSTYKLNLQLLTRVKLRLLNEHWGIKIKEKDNYLMICNS